MTPHQKMLVQTTFAQVAPIAETAAALFYTRLFELDPVLRPLFTTDIQEQGRKLMQTLTVAVAGLDDLDALVPAVRALGKRHVSYGLRDEHYETVATALIWTLETGLGEAFSFEVREAWATVYWILADTMKDGAAEPLRRTAQAGRSQSLLPWGPHPHGPRPSLQRDGEGRLSGCSDAENVGTG